MINHRRSENIGPIKNMYECSITQTKITSDNLPRFVYTLCGRLFCDPITFHALPEKYLLLSEQPNDNK